MLGEFYFLLLWLSSLRLISSLLQFCLLFSPQKGSSIFAQKSFGIWLNLFSYLAPSHRGTPERGWPPSQSESVCIPVGMVWNSLSIFFSIIIIYRRGTCFVRFLHRNHTAPRSRCKKSQVWSPIIHFSIKLVQKCHFGLIWMTMSLPTECRSIWARRRFGGSARIRWSGTTVWRAWMGTRGIVASFDRPQD